MIIIKCSVCGYKLYTNSWSGEHGLEETIKRCESCGYLDHWSYGQQELKVGKWHMRFTYHPYISKEDEKLAEKYFNEFQKRIRMRKYYYKHIKRSD